MSMFVSIGFRLAMVGLVIVIGSASLIAQEKSAKTSPSFESQFWNYLIANNYKNWAPPAGTDGNYSRGQAPHGPLQKLYLNRTAAANPATLPDESVMVLENYRPDKSLQSIDVMVRSLGTDSASKDWYLISYGPDGSVRHSSGRPRLKSSTPDVQLAAFVDATAGPAAGVQSCTQCHGTAPGSDFAFFNQPQRSHVAGDTGLESPR